MAVLRVTQLKFIIHIIYYLSDNIYFDTNKINILAIKIRNKDGAAAASKTGTANGDGANGYGTNAVDSKTSFTTVAISRSLTSGATLAATYNSFDESLTLKASVAF